MGQKKASQVGYEALQRAKEFLGVKEQPPNSNRGPYDYQLKGGIDDWCRRANGLVGYPWCSAFVCAMFSDVGRKITEPRRASVGFLEQWAKENGYLVDRPFRGDLVCYRFDSDNWPDHIGIVERVLSLPRGGRPYLIQAIEGNTSYGDDANGGKVMRRVRLASRCKFIRIPDRP